MKRDQLIRLGGWDEDALSDHGCVTIQDEINKNDKVNVMCSVE